MAGITNAKTLYKEGATIGVVLSCGFIVEDYERTNHYITRLYDIKGNDHGIKTIFDYGSDSRVEDIVQARDVISLHILDEYSASWELVVNPTEQYPFLG
jgi:hypothetical protein